MRDTFVKTLIEEAKKDKNIELVTGDLGFGVLKPYFEQLPNQFTNAGIAEQNMTGVAAGMALCGKTVFTYSIGNFPTLRCIEQIRNDCAYPHANVKIVCVGGGFVYGSLGMSHQATEDIAILRALPDVTVVCPGDLVEAAEATRAIAHIPGTVYLRLGRGGEKRVHGKIENFQIGKAIKLQEAKADCNKNIALFSTGAILDEATDAAKILEEEGIGVEEYSFHTVKPIDKDVILDCANRFDYIVTVEEHNVIGGFASAVSEVITDSDENVRLIKIGLNDEYCSKVGNQKYLRAQYGMTAQDIVKKVKETVR
ncbi:transketolase family protein [uncultured Eubacterium sp.]|uniref:transketolase family protein n=1 Tax=uncultured Eubacterium sp. TaxID=165185 RepID=UPI0015BC3C0E|nr:transketolase C-terminal domain-containing protein [uncultured Eubacterium sp.]